MDAFSLLLGIGAYFIYIAHFHSILPKHHGVLKKAFISHSVFIGVFALLFLVLIN